MYSKTRYLYVAKTTDVKFISLALQMNIFGGKKETHLINTLLRTTHPIHFYNSAIHEES